MNSRAIAAAMMFALMASGVSMTTAAARATPPSESPGDVITASQLAVTVERVNETGFDVPGVPARRAQGSFLPVALRNTDTTDERRFVASESAHVASMADLLAGSAGGEQNGEEVVDIKVTVDETHDDDGLRMVTLQVSRRLANGTLWEELTPYVVGLDGGPLAAGEIVRVDMDALVSGDVPAALQDRPEVPQLNSGRAHGGYLPTMTIWLLFAGGGALSVLALSVWLVLFRPLGLPRRR